MIEKELEKIRKLCNEVQEALLEKKEGIAEEKEDTAKNIVKKWLLCTQFPKDLFKKEMLELSLQWLSENKDVSKIPYQLAFLCVSDTDFKLELDPFEALEHKFIIDQKKEEFPQALDKMLHDFYATIDLICEWTKKLLEKGYLKNISQALEEAKLCYESLNEYLKNYQKYLSRDWSPMVKNLKTIIEQNIKIFEEKSYNRYRFCKSEKDKELADQMPNTLYIGESEEEEEEEEEQEEEIKPTLNTNLKKN